MLCLFSLERCFEVLGVSLHVKLSRISGSFTVMILILDTREVINVIVTEHFNKIIRFRHNTIVSTNKADKD